MSISASDARRNLFGLIRQVNDDRDTVEIVSRAGNAVLVSKDEWDAIQETNYLLRSPANAEWILDSLAQARRGEAAERELDRDT